ncbi:hypothetical protein DL546_006468 [Coniochaeta pulveracea]|uniref:Phospholipase A2 domain-containing protein n=1 Tax=Coniochaeta pulveracea TaxID=177199 RepID=A0A420YFH4_9PEZI|nr:hypothetical protein DL546_006468 [Coniochaeta pulveracea]
MVSFKWIFLTAAAATSVLAQDPPTGDDAAAAAYWNEASGADLVDSDPSVAKRDATLVHVARTDSGEATKDPYWGRHCHGKYNFPPCKTTCNRNNCFRSFLNARDGSDGKHCPKDAFGFCCAWNKADPWTKYWAYISGFLHHIAPYTDNCKNDKDKWYDVIGKIDDVCGCTLAHQVLVTPDNDYLALNYKPECKKH